MSTGERIEQARKAYEQAVYRGDVEGLAGAESGLADLEADTALARGRILHARFLADRASGEDPAELPLFERAAELYRSLADSRGEGEALFWIGCVHQVIRRDNAVAVALFERARQSASDAGDLPTQAEALRHLGIAAHMAGRLSKACELLEESSRLRQRIGALSGVAANMVGLAYIASAQNRHSDATAILDEAHVIATSQQAHAIIRQIEEARAAIEN
ncbi:tetratricopeptide repeat protein [Actinoplanes couchii]|uniref:Tetratricopeptide repeat protein n=1 Tax=Actinoplanes couchii TaxID=403638 RepID=A0ABQ3XK17_9ACTN|nr:tetratricopeptide repeat protein [Actinoplanes couchii]MDR6320444.1 tetratricopeptide (TPR) repeat protein [Actinoplanes couchii]GID58847.1 hypothetical protein Aco03nite_072510 [Actinoplanes couchii]